MKRRKFDLEDRLVDFTCSMIDVIEALPNTRSGNYIAGQLMRCSHIPALMYVNARASESTNDFLHKLSIVLNELKECRVTLKIIGKKDLIKPSSRLDDVFKETQMLITIIRKSISTAKRERRLSIRKPDIRLYNFRIVIK